MQYALYQGFYVQLDFHGNKGGDQSFYDTEFFITSWKKLLTCVFNPLSVIMLPTDQTW